MHQSSILKKRAQELQSRPFKSTALHTTQDWKKSKGCRRNLAILTFSLPLEAGFKLYVCLSLNVWFSTWTSGTCCDVEQIYGSHFHHKKGRIPVFSSSPHLRCVSFFIELWPEMNLPTLQFVVPVSRVVNEMEGCCTCTWATKNQPLSHPLTILLHTRRRIVPIRL